MIGAWLRKEGRVIRAVWPFLEPYRWALPVTVVLGTVVSFLEGIGISLFIPLLQAAEPGGPVSDNRWVQTLTQVFAGIPFERRIVIISLVILASIFLRTLLGYANKALYLWLSYQTYHDLVIRVYRQLLAVSLRFIERDSAGRIYNVLTNQTSRVSVAVGSVLGLTTTVCSLSVYVAILLALSWRLTLIAAAAMLLISLVLRFITRNAERLGQEATTADTHLSHRIVEGLEGIELIRTFGTEAFEVNRLKRASLGAFRAGIRRDLTVDLVTPVSEFLASILLVVMLNYSLQQPENVSVLLVFIFMLYRIQPRIGALDGYRAQFASLTSPVLEVVTFLSPHGKPFIRSGTRPVEDIKEGVTFDGVSYSYDQGDDPALNNISLLIPVGQTTALVGPSGAGKSTLSRLLVRLYDPTEGRILLDGIPLEELDIAAWNARIATVSQDIYIFDTTIRENIAYSQQDASDEAIINAAKYAHAHDFICELPQGYDTLVGDRGVRLSGGQKQRLSLARAFLRDPDILILDEATNALDSISEHTIQEALERFGRERTVLIIAHRLATIRQADNIVVLEAGHIRERGTFDELVAQGGLFAQLHALQYEQTQP